MLAIDLFYQLNDNNNLRLTYESYDIINPPATTLNLDSEVTFWWDVQSHEKNLHPHSQKILGIKIPRFEKIPISGDKNRQIWGLRFPKKSHPKATSDPEKATFGKRLNRLSLFYRIFIIRMYLLELQSTKK